MRTTNGLLLALLILDLAATFAIGAVGGTPIPLRVRESDGSPNVGNVRTINVSNGTLTDNGGGNVTILTGTNGGGGGGSLTDVVTNRYTPQFTNRNKIYVEDPAFPGTFGLVLDGTTNQPSIITAYDLLTFGTAGAQFAFDGVNRRLYPANTPASDLGHPSIYWNRILGSNLTLAVPTRSRVAMINGSGDLTNVTSGSPSTEYVKADGSVGTPGGGGTPGGTTASVQFNETGAFRGTNRFQYDATNHALSIGTGLRPESAFQISNNSSTAVFIDMSASGVLQRMGVRPHAVGTEQTSVGVPWSLITQGTSVVDLAHHRFVVKGLGGIGVIEVTNVVTDSTTGPGMVTVRPTLGSGSSSVGLSVLGTSVGTGSGAQYLQKNVLAAGYTGSATTVALESDNSAASTGQTLFDFKGNFGVAGDALGTTVGQNVGAFGYAVNARMNYGVWGAAAGTQSQTTNVGGFFTAGQNSQFNRAFGIVAIADRIPENSMAFYWGIRQQAAATFEVSTNAGQSWAMLTMTNNGASATYTAGIYGDGRAVVGGSTNRTTAGLTVHNGIAVGNTSAIITNILTGSATLDFANTGSGAVADLPITVTGAASGDVVSIGVPPGSITGIVGSYFGFASNDTVYVRFIPTAAAQNPASGTFRALVTKF